MFVYKLLISQVELQEENKIIRSWEFFLVSFRLLIVNELVSFCFRMHSYTLILVTVGIVAMLMTCSSASAIPPPQCSPSVLMTADSKVRQICFVLSQLANALDSSADDRGKHNFILCLTDFYYSLSIFFWQFNNDRF